MKDSYGFLLGLLLFIHSSLVSGQTIEGKITDSLSKPIPFASVNLINSKALIVSYAITSADGAFKLKVPVEIDLKDLSLSVNVIGYKQEKRTLTKTSNAYDFVLKAESYQLQTVFVKDKRPVLRVRGDTIGYNVADFGTAQDRVIGDVIKKLPGISVDAQGKISYNGKPISNFYIGGDDLLDDRYNMATSSIPAQAVDKVEIMRKHQPIKILKGKVVSDDVALNIKIKDGAKLHLLGQAELAGGSPGKYDVNVNGMMFKDRFKAINYIKANNVGKNVGDDLIAHNAIDAVKRIDNVDPDALLSLGIAGTPDLPASRYLFNNAALLSVNNLIHLKTDVQGKVNISYLHDRQKQQYSTISETYLNNDTIRFTEKQDNRQLPDLLHLQLNINVNKTKTYLNEAFSGDFNHSESRSLFQTNGRQANQTLDAKVSKLSNEFNYLLTLKNGLVCNFFSHISYFTNPQVLSIDSGLSIPMLLSNTNANGIIQRLDIPTWSTNNYFSIKSVLNKIILKYKFGFNTQSQLFNSSLHPVASNHTVQLNIDSAINDLRWFRSKVYLDAGFDIPGNKIALSFNLPVILQHTQYLEKAYDLNDKANNLFINPQIKVIYQLGQESDLSANYLLTNNVSTVEDVSRGYILKNYRTLDANNAGLITQQLQTTDLTYNFKKSAKMLFISLNARFSHLGANSIRSSIINQNYQRNITLPYRNETNIWTLNANFSKYLFSFNSTVSGGPLWQVATTNQIQNAQLVPATNQLSGANLSINTKINQRLSFSYKGNIAYSQTKVAGMNKSNFKQFNQQTSLFYVPKEQLTFTISLENYLSKQPVLNRINYTFVDLLAHYSIKSSKLSLDLTAVNLLNTKSYTTSYFSGNNFTSSTYNIPGRMILGKIIFNY